MNSTQAYALSKKYVDDTANALGSLKGASATIKKVEHKDGQTKVTFLWTGDDKVTKYETTITIEDGTNIYTYTPGDLYKYGDLCIYSGNFYRCTHEHIAPNELIISYWDTIGNGDGNYGLVEDHASLPSRYTPSDRKLFYVINEGIFYLWDGEKWAEQQPKSISKEKIDALFK